MSKYFTKHYIIDDNVIGYGDCQRGNFAVTYEYVEFKRHGVLKNVELPSKLAARLESSHGSGDSISIYAIKPNRETYLTFSNKKIHVFALGSNAGINYLAEDLKPVLGTFSVSFFYVIGGWFVFAYCAVVLIACFFDCRRILNSICIQVAS